MKTKECKYCGQTGLVWTRVEGRWRLQEPSTGKLHTCVADRTKADYPTFHPSHIPPVTPGVTASSHCRYLPACDTKLNKVLDAINLDNMGIHMEQAAADLAEPDTSEPSILESLLSEL